MVLPFANVQCFPGLRLSPMGVVPQAIQQACPIVDYTLFSLIDTTQPNAPYNSMQFGHALAHIIWTILLANPPKGLVTDQS